MNPPARFLISPLSRESIARIEITPLRTEPHRFISTVMPSPFASILRFIFSALTAWALLMPCKTAAQNVGDFILPEKTASTGRTTNRYWPKGASKLWGTNGSSLPISITIGSGLSLDTGTNTLTASGGGGGGSSTLAGLTDVTITTPANNQLLRYSTATSKWINWTPDFLVSSDLSPYLTSATAATTYQPLDSDLTSIAALTTTTFGRSLLTQADASATRTTLGLGTLATQNGTISDYLTTATAATTYQPLDSDLTSIAALTTTTFGRSLLTQADASATRTTLGLGTLATQNGTISDYLTTATAATTYQPLDSDLTSIAALTTTSYGRGFLTLADAAAARTAVGLDFDDSVQFGQVQGNNFYGALFSGSHQGAGNQAYGWEHNSSMGTTVSYLITDDLHDAMIWLTPAESGRVLTDNSNLNGSKITTGTVADARLSANVSLLGSSIALGSEVTGTLPIANGGTGQTTAAAARVALLPSLSGNAGKFLKVNGTETDVEFINITGGGDALTSNPLSQFASTTSAQLAGVISDETGSGSLVFGTSPTLTTPSIAKLANLTSNGLVTTSGGDGTLSVDTTTKTRADRVEIGIACSDLSTAITTGTTKEHIRAPCSFTLTEVRAYALTAGTGSSIIIDINESGSSVLSTKLSIDAGEKTSEDAATPPVISDSAIADDAEITIDFDQVGTGATGVKIWLIGTRN